LSDAVLRTLQERGATTENLLILQADVTDAAQLTSALQTVRSRWESLDLVLHAAGVAGGGTMERRSVEAMLAVLAPKVDGTRNLLAATEADDATIVLCSSAASIEGAYGQADYVAANAFMDAVAIAACRSGRRVVSVSWQTWQDVGMAAAAALPSNLVAVRDALLSNALPSTAALAALDGISALPCGHLAVYRRGAGAQAPKHLTVANLRSMQQGGERHPRPDLSTTYEAPEGELQRRLVNIWEEYLGIAPIGISDYFLELGGHSLLAAQIVARLRDEFELDVPVSLLFELQSVAEVAIEIERLILDELETKS
jgi:acyl carrier protein